MHKDYADVTTRFLRQDERLVVSEETEMPLVIEARESKTVAFLQTFLAANSTLILADISKYGAVLLRGFDIANEEDFEKTVLSIQGMRGISDAFMSEEGRIPVGELKYVLHTNAVYKTGGTLYLGGFHSENYYSADVPAYISFCCIKPSELGGETGLVHMEKIYQELEQSLKDKLEKQPFFVSKWLVSEIAERYKLSAEKVEQLARYFNLPTVGEGENKFVLMYKPSVYIDPETKKASLQINLFEVETLNTELRRCFMDDYQGKTWFWHRFVWKLPTVVLKALEYVYIMFASFFFSPKDSMKILLNKLRVFKADKLSSAHYDKTRVGSCFNEKEVKILARLLRSYYSSCLWQKGDILLVDNTKVAHAGMPGSGPRLVRAMICNPLEMSYKFEEPGSIQCINRSTETLGHYMASGVVPGEGIKSSSKKVVKITDNIL